MKVDSGPVFDPRPAAAVLVLLSRPVMTRQRQFTETLGIISHIFFAKWDVDIAAPRPAFLTRGFTAFATTSMREGGLFFNARRCFERFRQRLYVNVDSDPCIDPYPAHQTPYLRSSAGDSQRFSLESENVNQVHCTMNVPLPFFLVSIFPLLSPSPHELARKRRWPRIVR